MHTFRLPTYPGLQRLRMPVPLILLLAALACNTPGRPVAQSLDADPMASLPPIPTQIALTETPTDTATPTLTATATATPTPTPTATATGTPTLTASPSPAPTNTPPPTATSDPNYTPPAPTAAPTATAGGATATAAPTGANRFDNPGFEGSTRPVIFGEVNVYNGWEPFYCDEPYTKAKCPAERRDTQSPPRPGYNDPGLLMGRPEYKPTDVANRIHGGSSAQQWFCFFRVCRAGVFQTIRTRPGEVCEVSAYVQSWSAAGPQGTDGQAFTSDTATADDRDNSSWRIKVDLSGGSNAFDQGLLESRKFTYEDKHYDRYAKISFTFTATGERTTIFFENLRLWPFAHNDSYIDDATAICSGG